MSVTSPPPQDWRSSLERAGPTDERPASRPPARWQHLFAWRFHGFHGQGGWKEVHACGCVWGRKKKRRLHVGSICLHEHVVHIIEACAWGLGSACAWKCLLEFAWARLDDNPTGPAELGRHFIHGLIPLKLQWHNTFWQVLCGRRCGSLFGRRLHWSHCVLHWHKCLLGHFICLQFRPGRDRGSWVTKLLRLAVQTFEKETYYSYIHEFFYEKV